MCGGTNEVSCGAHAHVGCMNRYRAERSVHASSVVRGRRRLRALAQRGAMPPLHQHAAVRPQTELLMIERFRRQVFATRIARMEATRLSHAVSCQSPACMTGKLLMNDRSLVKTTPSALRP